MLPSLRGSDLVLPPQHEDRELLWRPDSVALGSDSMQFMVEIKKKKGDTGKGRTERPKAVSVICINQTVEDSTRKSESTDALQRK